MTTRRAVAALLLAAALGTTTTAAPPPRAPVHTAPVAASLKLSKAGDAAVRTLLDARVFGGWAVGAAAAPTPGVQALRTILKERNAVAALAFVQTHATLAGQLMALAGLYDVDPAAFKAALPAYLSNKEMVRVAETGCMRGPDRTAASLVRAPDAVQTGGAGKPLPPWQPKQRGAWMVLDLAGGGYAAAMRDKTP